MGSKEESVNKCKETFIYLDFNDKLPQELLEDKIFIRIANLEDKNPLVQINDMVFKGNYDHSIGTNLFFKKTLHNGLSEFPFQQPVTVSLEILTAQTKILNCKQMRIPPSAVTVPEIDEKIHFNFKWNYEELLENFDTLDLKDMVGVIMRELCENSAIMIEA